jgi:glycosyltransferase involved in cell wall biosynthesis
MKKYVIIGDGESVHLLKWVRALSSNFDLYLISFRSIHPEMINLIKPQNVYQFNLQIASSGGNIHLLKQLLKVNRILKSIKPDIVNPHYITAYGLIASICKRFFHHSFFLIQSTWGTDILVTPFRNKAFLWAAKFTLNQADLITSDSEVMTQKIHQLSKVKVETFTFGIEKMPDLEYSDKDSHLYFSNRALSANYRIDLVIRLFAEIYQMDSLARLIISNDGELRNELENLIQELHLSQVVSLVGFLKPDQQNEIYKKAQFYLSLPKSDSTSVSLLEAMAHGCIPVVSDLEANREWIASLQNGLIYTGEIFPLEFLLAQRISIFEHNRLIIKQRAVFKDGIDRFLRKNGLMVNSLFEGL